MTDEQKHAIEHAQKVLRAVKLYDLATSLAADVDRQATNLNDAWAEKNGKEKWGHEPTAKGLFEDGWAACLASSTRTQGADDAQPVAIYQIEQNNGSWLDLSKDAYESTEGNRRRIVYATRATPADQCNDPGPYPCEDENCPMRGKVHSATPADHISQARDAVIEQCAKVCDEAEDGYGTDLRKQTASYLALVIRALKSAPPEKPAGDVSDI